MDEQANEAEDGPRSGWRARAHEVIFEADTTAGKLFDVALIVCILASVAVVMLDSVESIRQEWHGVFFVLEWSFTLLFAVEYALRLACVDRPLRYARSFFGVIDLLAILPSPLGLVLEGTQYLRVIRILRVLRVFRVLKLAQYLTAAQALSRALYASRRKIAVFLFTVLTLVVILGSLMYVIEGGQPNSGFTSIPVSVYWAIVTLTTVGYGDISPVTPHGQTLAALIMILGYSIIAVPTGIVTAEMAKQEAAVNTQACPACGAEGHDDDAKHCKYCGARL